MSHNIGKILAEMELSSMSNMIDSMLNDSNQIASHAVGACERKAIIRLRSQAHAVGTCSFGPDPSCFLFRFAGARRPICQSKSHFKTHDLKLIFLFSHCLVSNRERLGTSL